MRTRGTAGSVAVAVVALGLALTGCSSDGKTAASSSSDGSGSPSTSSKAPGGAGRNETIADYIKDNKITETPVHRGDIGAPSIQLSAPQGWVDGGDQTPPSVLGAIFYGDPAMASNPPTIVAVMSKLTGNVDQAKIIEYAPGELKNLPNFQSMGEGAGGKVSGFDGYQIGGTYVKDGAKRMIAQKTVVIPAKDGSGLFVLQVNASGTEGQIDPLMQATQQIDQGTVITP